LILELTLGIAGRRVLFCADRVTSRYFGFLFSFIGKGLVNDGLCECELASRVVFYDVLEIDES